MSKPFVIVSDLHFHNWNAFSAVSPHGMNTRMEILLAELARASRELKKAGGDTMILAGDVFHVRGSVSPSVLNPVLDLLRSIVDAGIRVHVLAGNHDLEGKHSSRLGSAVTSLESVGCNCISENSSVIYTAQGVGGMSVRMVPWIDSVTELKKILELNKGEEDYLIIHAPINGVLRGLPETGLDPAWLAGLGYKAVFAGHYHNHKSFPGNVYSIGALAHHSWSDVGSKAGFLLVWPEPDPEVKWFASHAPSFIELDDSMSVSDMKLAADGNYVKVRLASSDLSEVTAIRELLSTAGAWGVTVISEPTKSAVSRAASGVKTGVTLEESIDSFINAGAYANKPALALRCQQILTDIRSIT